MNRNKNKDRKRLIDVKKRKKREGNKHKRKKCKEENNNNKNKRSMISLNWCSNRTQRMEFSLSGLLKKSNVFIPIKSTITKLHQKRKISSSLIMKMKIKMNLNLAHMMMKNLHLNNKMTIRKVKKKRNKRKFKENKRKSYKKELYKKRLLRKRKLKPLLKRKKWKSSIRQAIESNSLSSKSLFVGIMPYHHGHQLTIIMKQNLKN